MYDFSTLSPSDFEILVRDLLDAAHEWNLKAFAWGADGGVDLKMDEVPGQQRAGRTTPEVVVQCKHYVRSTAAVLQRALVAERTRIITLDPLRYIVATSAHLTAGRFDSILKAMSPPLASGEDLLHRPDLNKLLSAHPEVERKHFKLWLASSTVLEQLLRNGSWSRAERLLESVSDRARLYVPHDGFDRAQRVLEQSHLVVIAGAPGVGKSMLAEMILLNHWKQNWQVVEVTANIEEAWSAYRPDSPQIFYYDDFLGQTDLAELGKNESASIERFVAALKQDQTKRLVLTTRTQVLRQGRTQHEPLARVIGEYAIHTVHIGDYSNIARARILYNHLYFSGLQIRVLKDFVVENDRLWDILHHPNFSPRVISQVLQLPFANSDDLTNVMLDALDRPVLIWQGTFENGLSAFARSLVLTLCLFPPNGVYVDDLLRSCPTPTPDSHKRNQALKVLEGTWILIRGEGGHARVTFADPSCRDFALDYLQRNTEETLRLAERASTAGLTMLLRYASSRDVALNPYVRPQLRRTIVAESDYFRSLALGLLEGCPTEEVSELPALLCALLDVRELLGDDVPSWLEETLVLLSRRYNSPRVLDVDSVAKVWLWVHDSGIDHGKDVTDALFSLARSVALSASEPADFERSEDIGIRLWRLDPHRHRSFAAQLEESIERYLLYALESLTQNFTDRDAMFSELDRLKKFARNRGMLDELSAEFFNSEQRALTFSAKPPRQTRVEATESLGVSNSPEPKQASVEDEIRALFRGLYVGRKDPKGPRELRRKY